MSNTTARYETVQVFDCQLDNGGGKTPHVVVSLRIVEGPNTGSNLIWRGYLSEKAAPYTLKGLRALGWTGTKVSKAMQEGLGTRKGRAQLKTEVWEGKAREKVNGIFAIEDRAMKIDNPIEVTDLEAFDSLFEGAAEAIEMPKASEAAKAGELPPTVKRTPVVANPNDLGY